MKNSDSVVVIGAGASGLMAAGRAAQLGKEVILLEKMASPGRKILMSGNSRCNLTNSSSLEDFIPMYGQNGHFLYSAFKHFFRSDLLQLLQKYGLATSQEPDGRIFPSSNRSADVVHGLQKFVAEYGASLITSTRVTGISQQTGSVSGVTTKVDFYPASAVIIATGGTSYPQTGSSGDGYELARSIGHSLVKPRPALVPLVFKEPELAKELQGISLPAVRLTSFSCPASDIKVATIPRRDIGRGLPGKKSKIPVIESRCGSIIFTHFGISGPAALLMSLAIVRALEESPVSISIDLLPDKTPDQVDILLHELLTLHGARNIRNVIRGLITERIADLVLVHAKTEPDTKACRISSQQRQSITSTIKSLQIDISGTRPISEAMVTAGGVCLDEINPRTMQSRLVKGLYFCGEVMDIDADTGGFNLQAAFSTGYLAGESAASLSI